MMNQPGYPLPDGDAYTDDLVCQLVYLPNKDKYWQALLAALHYFSTWKAWERDDDRRGADAALAWRESFELTMGCWRMNCLESLQDDVAAILVLLRDRKDCCDDNITYGPQIEVETEIEPESGDPPDYYGETAVTDWDDWLEHVCYNAHAYVDSLVWQAQEMNTLLALGGIGIGLLGAALVLLSFAGIGLAVTYALVAATAAGILELGSLGVFLTTADDIEDARTDIVCALMQGTGLRQAVEDALGSASLDWLSFFSQIDYESATAIIYEGGYGTEYLPADTRDDCIPCEDYGHDEYGMWAGEYHAEWDMSLLTLVGWEPFECSTSGYGWDKILSAIRSEYNAIFGISNVSWKMVRIEFDYQFNTGGSSEPTTYGMRLWTLKEVTPSWAWEVVWTQWSTGAGGTWDEWHHQVVTDAELADVYVGMGSRRPLYFDFTRDVPQLNRKFQLKNVQVWVAHE